METGKRPWEGTENTPLTVLRDQTFRGWGQRAQEVLEMRREEGMTREITQNPGHAGDSGPLSSVGGLTNKWGRGGGVRGN